MMIGEIVGGPHDGRCIRVRFDGELEERTAKEWETTMDKVNFDGHSYKILDYNKSNHTAKFFW